MEVSGGQLAALGFIGKKLLLDQQPSDPITMSSVFDLSDPVLQTVLVAFWWKVLISGGTALLGTLNARTPDSVVYVLLLILIFGIGTLIKGGALPLVLSFFL